MREANENAGAVVRYSNAKMAKATPQTTDTRRMRRRTWPACTRAVPLQSAVRPPKVAKSDSPPKVTASGLGHKTTTNKASPSAISTNAENTPHLRRKAGKSSRDDLLIDVVLVGLANFGVTNALESPVDKLRRIRRVGTAPHLECSRIPLRQKMLQENPSLF